VSEDTVVDGTVVGTLVKPPVDVESRRALAEKLAAFLQQQAQKAGKDTLKAKGDHGDDNRADTDCG
jgi:hypothetical protein